MKFKGRRVDGWIALYVYGNHGSHDDSPKRGLKGEAKARADAAVLSGRRSDSVFDDFHRESILNRKKVLSSESIEDPTREKRKLENRMSYTRRKSKFDNGSFESSIAALIEACKVHATTIGDFYEHYKDLQGYPTNVDDDCDPLRFVHVLEHDVGERPDGEWNLFVFTVTSAARSAYLAANLCKKRPLGECESHCLSSIGTIIIPLVYSVCPAQ
jgi:chorismate mutase